MAVNGQNNINTLYDLLGIYYVQRTVSTYKALI